MEAIEYPREMFRRNPTAVIGDGEPQSAIVTEGFDADMSTRVRMRQGVLDEIADGPLEKRSVERNRDPVTNGKIEADARLTCGGIVKFADGAELLTDIQQFPADLRLRVFCARQEQEAVDHTREAEALFQGRAQYLAVLLGGSRFAEGNFHFAPDRRLSVLDRMRRTVAAISSTGRIPLRAMP